MSSTSIVPLVAMPQLCRVSVVIPCRNEEGFIERCINSLLASDLTNIKLEILVVDGLSDDNTRRIVSNIVELNANVHLIDNSERTTPFALNIGIKHLDFDVVIILGAHATVNPDFVQLNVNALRSDGLVGCSGGIIENVYANNNAENIGLAMAHPFGVGNAHFRTGRYAGYVDTVAFGAYRREVFDAVGYFDEELVRNQDDEFNFRVTQAGYKILLDPDIRSQYVVRADLKRLFKQYEQYGYWKVYVNRKHRQITTWRQLVPAVWVLYLIAGAVLSALISALRPIYVLGLIVYFLVALVIAASVAGGIGGTLGVLRAFLVLHFSYGWGYLRGILDHLILNKGPSTKSKGLTR